MPPGLWAGGSASPRATSSTAIDDVGLEAMAGSDVGPSGSMEAQDSPWSPGSTATVRTDVLGAIGDQIRSIRVGTIGGGGSTHLDERSST